MNFSSVWINELSHSSPNAIEDLSSGTEKQASLSKRCALDESSCQLAMLWLIMSSGFPEALWTWTQPSWQPDLTQRRLTEGSMTLQSTLYPIQYRTVVSAEWLKNGSTFPTLIITLRAAKTVWANGRYLAWLWVPNMSCKASQISAIRGRLQVLNVGGIRHSQHKSEVVYLGEVTVALVDGDLFSYKTTVL